MNLLDLKALQASKKWSRFIYLSENQESCSEPVMASITLQEMTVCPDPPAMVHFKGAGNWLSFVSVTKIGRAHV